MTEFLDGRLLAKFKEGTTIEMVREIIPSAELEREVCGIAVITFHDLDVLDEAAALEKSGLVEYAHPDHLYRATLPVPVNPNDPYFASGYQWALKNEGQNSGVAGADIAATYAWGLLQANGYSIGSSSCKVGVIDTGVDYNHPDLAANCKKADGMDFYNLDSDPMDDGDHGTHVAGIIGAVGNNGAGVAGIAWACRIYAIKALNASMIATDTSILYSIDFASMNGISIVNMSLGSYSYSLSLRNAIYNLRNDILFVCACGNDGENIDSHPFYPAAYDCPNIISVCNTNNKDQLNALSNYGATLVHVAAPGSNICSCYPGGDYVWLSGTSMAAPQVTGIAVLLKSAFPALTPSQIRAAILDNVDVKASLSGKCSTGGRVNAYKALSQYLEAPDVVLGVQRQSAIREIGADDKYYARRNGAWVEIPGAGYTAGEGIEISNNVISSALLDGSGLIVASYLPSSITGAVSYAGTFNPYYGAPLPAVKGNYFVATASGLVEATEFAIGDWLVYRDDTNWDKIDNSGTTIAWGSVTDKPDTFPPTLGTTDTTAYRGDRGQTAYQHAISQHAPVDAQKNSDITKEEIEAKLTGSITTHSHTGLLPASHASSHISTGSDIIPNAVAGSASGLMSAADKTKLDGIAAGAMVNVRADWNSSSGYSEILNKPTLGSVASYDVGVSSYNIVQIGSDGKLPAIDGSKLTGVISGGDVDGPDTTIENYVPQWDSTNKKLKVGVAIGVASGNLVQLDANAKLPALDGSNLTGLIASNLSYIAGSDAYTLPGSPSVGTYVDIIGNGTPWSAIANAGQYIRYYTTESVSGGTLSGATGFESAIIVYIGEVGGHPTWYVKSAIGSLTLV